MGFKMRSGNKTAFKEMGSSEGSPLEIGKWTGMMANKQKFIGDEIQARRKAKGDGKEDDEEDKTTTTKTDPKPKNDPPKNDPPKDDPPKNDPPKDDPPKQEKINRAEFAFGDVGDSKGSESAESFHKHGFVGEDEKGRPTIKKYEDAWNDGRFTVSEDGTTRTDVYGNTYANTDEGYKAFEDASEKWWNEQADNTNNEKLRKTNQSYGRKYD
jgi:hypothetical protein